MKPLLVLRDDLPDVLVVPEGTPARDVTNYLRCDGPVPEGGETMTLEAFLARGRLTDCDCGLLVCACLELRPHAKLCGFRRARTNVLVAACQEHGKEACLACDCTCVSRVSVA